MAASKVSALEARVANLERVVLSMARALHETASEKVNFAEESFKTFDAAMIKVETLLPESLADTVDEDDTEAMRGAPVAGDSPRISPGRY